MTPLDASSPGISLRGLTATVPDGTGTRTLLDRIDLDVAPGEVVVISGASGSGKSTLLAIAGLLRRAESGEVVIAGMNTSGLSERRRTELRRRRIAIVFQSANLFPALTAREQLELVAHINGGRRGAARAQADLLLADLGVAEQADQLPAKLSGGERQRVGIARALMGGPEVLLADEPTAALDPVRAADVVERLTLEAHRHGLATIVVAHDDAPLRHADRHLHLDDGHLRDVPVPAV